MVQDIVVLEVELLLTFSENAWDGCRVRRRECTVWRSASVVLSHNYLVFLAVLSSPTESGGNEGKAFHLVFCTACDYLVCRKTI